MNFSSFGYIFLFLPVVTLLCLLARKLPYGRSAQLCVLLASLVFYSWAKPANLLYLLGSILVNWLVARWIGGAQGNRRKHLLQLGLVLNIAFLCTFKYLNFFISNVPWLASHHVHAPDLAYPLGISFFTLAQIMYLVDCYEELVAPSSLFDHATFVSFFPYVISGPISRAKRIIHQFPVLNGPTPPSAELVGRALYLFSFGLIKKVVLADAFSKAADYGWGNISSLSAIEAWAVVSAYALQLYFDFSGYSDMAIASGMLLGIELPRNFDAPLKSLSIIEFWQRWHITLSAFITTYLYTPIVRSFRRATVHTAAVATLIAMTIAGLWHGANWTFVIFGTIHGSGLAINQYWKKKKMPALPNWLCWVLTILLIDVGFVFFRSPDLGTALQLLSRLGNWHSPFGSANFRLMDGDGTTAITFLLIQAAGAIAALVGKSTDQLAQRFRPTWLNYATTVLCTLTALLYLNSNVPKPFVYFKF